MRRYEFSAGLIYIIESLLEGFLNQLKALVLPTDQELLQKKPTKLKNFLSKAKC